VDVILRHTNSDQCDPLELDELGRGGPVGLLQAVRAGNVAIANALVRGWSNHPFCWPFFRGCAKGCWGSLSSCPTWPPGGAVIGMS